MANKSRLNYYVSMSVVMVWLGTSKLVGRDFGALLVVGCVTKQTPVCRGMQVYEVQL